VKRPIHTQSPGRGSAGGGYRQPVGELWTQLLAELHGLRDRVATSEVAGSLAVPAAYQGVKVFTPEASTFSLADPYGGADLTVNYVVRDGQTYEIPIYFPGPGVFVARGLEVNVYQRFVTHGSPEQDYNFLARQHSTALADDTTRDGNLRTFRYSYFDLVGGANNNWPGYAEEPVPSINFWWNMADSKSQRYLADDLMPSQALMPMTNPRLASTAGEEEALLAYPLDGARFYFDAPWLVERDGQLRFLFRPTTPIYQLAAVAADEGQDVRVQVELYGERYETLQDAVRAGAMTRPVRSEEE